MKVSARTLFAIGCLASIPIAVEAASIQGPKRTALERLEDGDAIRRRMLLRGGRFEIAPAVGFTLNDPFRRTVLYGVQINYHISDSFALGGTVFGGYGMSTDLTDRIESERPDRAKSGAFTDIAFQGTVDLVFTPIIGKFALFGQTVLNYDMHAVVGFGATQLKGVEATAMTPVAGIGLRTFFNNGMALNLEARDYLYSSAPNAVSNAESKGKAEATEASFNNHFAVTMSVGFFFPQEPKRSK